MRTLLILLLLAATATADNTFTGRATDANGRGLYRVAVRAQGAYCAPLFELAPVAEATAYTNSFGYYSLALRNDCQSYSVRVLGGTRYPEEGFYPRAYAWGYNTFFDRTHENINFVWTAPSAKRGL